MDYSLQMIFIAENNEKSSMTITDVKPTITKGDILTLMDNIIANNIFSTKNGALVGKYNAQVVQKQVTKHDLSN